MINFAYGGNASCYKDAPEYVVQTTTIQPETKPIDPIQSIDRVQCGVSKTSNLHVPQGPGSRMINAAEAEEGDYPWIVNLKDTGLSKMSFCTVQGCHFRKNYGVK